MTLFGVKIKTKHAMKTTSGNSRVLSYYKGSGVEYAPKFCYNNRKK